MGLSLQAEPSAPIWSVGPMQPCARRGRPRPIWRRGPQPRIQAASRCATLSIQPVLKPLNVSVGAVPPILLRLRECHMMEKPPSTASVPGEPENRLGDLLRVAQRPSSDVVCRALHLFVCSMPDQLRPLRPRASSRSVAIGTVRHPESIVLKRVEPAGARPTCHTAVQRRRLPGCATIPGRLHIVALLRPGARISRHGAHRQRDHGGDRGSETFVEHLEPFVAIPPMK
jgi:hypothetical protein